MIDVEKFLCSLMGQAEKYHGEPLNRSNIQEALRDQGCEIVNGKLVKDSLYQPWPSFDTKFKVGDTICHREDSSIRHTIKEIDFLGKCYRCTDNATLEIRAAEEKYVVVAGKPEESSDLDLIIDWFAHIEQMATDRKTQNGFVMLPEDALDEIKVLAKNSQEYIKIHVVPRKPELSQRDIDQMICKFKNEPFRPDGRIADIYRRGIEDALKKLEILYGQGPTD